MYMTLYMTLYNHIQQRIHMEELLRILALQCHDRADIVSISTVITSILIGTVLNFNLNS